MAWPDWMIDAYLRKLLRPIKKRLETTPFADVADDLNLALLSSCGLHLRDDEPFDLGRKGDASYRQFAADVDPSDLMVTHGHYDETGVCEDYELAVPVTAVGALIDEGSVAALHPTIHSFRGYFHDVLGFVDDHTRRVAEELEAGAVNAALITPC